MAETQLITKADILETWHMGKNLNDDRINPNILRAQQSDLKPFLGDALYHDFITNLTDPKYQDLLNGKEYNLDGNTIFFNGVKPLLAAWSYARIIGNNQVFVSRGGVTGKVTENSDAQPNPLVQQRDRDAKSEALRLQYEVYNFLDQNNATYLFWTKGVSQDSPTYQSMKFTKV